MKEIELSMKDGSKKSITALDKMIHSLFNLELGKKVLRGLKEESFKHFTANEQELWKHQGFREFLGTIDNLNDLMKKVKEEEYDEPI